MELIGMPNIGPFTKFTHSATERAADLLRGYQHEPRHLSTEDVQTRVISAERIARTRQQEPQATVRRFSLSALKRWVLR